MSSAATRMDYSEVSQIERQIPYDITDMWNRKYGMSNLSVKQIRRHREQTCGWWRAGGEGWSGLWGYRMQTVMYRIGCSLRLKEGK